MPIEEGKGWFKGLRGKGDRSLEEQMLGLDLALAEAPGKTVLDLGCAEALISIEFAKAGAKSVHGVELLEHHLSIARELAKEIPCISLRQGDLNDLAFSQPDKQYDIVLALAVVHKMRFPGKGISYAARCAKSLVVFRWPVWMQKGVLMSKRGDNSVKVSSVLEAEGFELERELVGPRSELVHYWRKV